MSTPLNWLVTFVLCGIVCAGMVMVGNAVIALLRVAVEWLLDVMLGGNDAG